MQLNNEFNAEQATDLERYVLAAIRQLWEGNLLPGEIDEDSWLETFRLIWAAVAAGYGVDVAPATWPADAADLLAQLRSNTQVFAAFKNHQMTRAMGELLLDGDRLRTWEEFRDLANEISKVYNQQWLATEYNTAIGTGQMAAKWRELTGDPEFPNLKYITVGDQRVREAHASLDGIIRPANDPFWDTYFPPNGWNCRCDVQAVDDAPTEGDTPAPPMPDGFRNNPGKSGRIYDESHPYYDTPDAAAVRDAVETYQQDEE